jgi:PIN domain nuclease of toxin-antitoxin system
LSAAQIAAIVANETDVIAVSVISCWEIAKLVQLGRLALPDSPLRWFEQALSYPGLRLLPLTPEIVVESTQLPGDFHRDPADQMIVATARLNDCPLLTSDTKILRYPGVTTIS